MGRAMMGVDAPLVIGQKARRRVHFAGTGDSAVSETNRSEQSSGDGAGGSWFSGSSPDPRPRGHVALSIAT
jgi:hypothetical protein